MPALATGESGWTLSAQDPYLILSVSARGSVVEIDGKRYLHRGDPLALIDRILECIAPTPSRDLPFRGGLLGHLSYELLDPSDVPRAGSDAWLAFPRRFRIDPDDESPALEVEVVDLPSRELLARELGCIPTCDFVVACGESGVLHGHPLPQLADLRASVSPGRFIQAVRACKRYIRDGHIYQANLSYKLRRGFAADPRELFLATFDTHPTPHATFIDERSAQLVGASPELFLRRRGNRIQTRPIKGTRPRASARELDSQLSSQLASDSKEAAEHVMIVDLERNDLGRIARTGTVQVEGLAHVESFGTVHHLVSSVEAECRASLTVGALLRATFPSGSISGAPKIRAREVIRELEIEPRGPYTGATGWIAADGDVELAVAIRTAIVRHARIDYGVGAGIVADSDPEAEWNETLLKAKALAGALVRVEARPPTWTENTGRWSDSHP